MHLDNIAAVLINCNVSVYLFNGRVTLFWPKSIDHNILSSYQYYCYLHCNVFLIMYFCDVFLIYICYCRWQNCKSIC